MNDTELRLAYWRDGSTLAERLAALVLALSGYREIDPQAPLGGPDEKKDIVCLKGDLKWIGAVYFATAPVGFQAIKRKFLHDLQGADASYGGIAFVTNQTLTLGQRKSLEDAGEAAGTSVDIFHRERIRALLDSPSGFAARIQFLRIPMTLEDQLSWFSESSGQVAAAVATATSELLALKAMVESLSSGQAEVIRRTGALLGRNPQALTPDLLSATAFERHDGFAAITASLDIPHILLFHRLVCFDLPSRQIGRLRTRDVSLMGANGRAAAHIQPPAAQVVEAQLTALCVDWRTGFKGFGTTDQRLTALASFHAQFLVVHPFFDGNGRAARALLMQQCLDLFSRANMSLMVRGAAYYSALADADKGNLRPLAALIRPIVEG